jgi:hypothetical protein
MWDGLRVLHPKSETVKECTLSSRAGYYRSLQEHSPVEEEMLVRSTIQQFRGSPIKMTRVTL